jgi:hypothetical protein
MMGKSSRFPGTRPKWMLTHPKSGNLMCVESILGMNTEYFDKILFVFSNQHELDYNVSRGLQKCLRDCDLHTKTNFVILENETKSQSETIYQTIKTLNLSGFIMVKDSDSYFSTTINQDSNSICYYDLNEVESINARSKSYIQLDVNNLISNIIEKKVVSPYFSVGGYCFESAEKFQYYYEKIQEYPGECFISNIVYEMILDGENFFGNRTSNYEDWGTLTEWNKYCQEYGTYFVDLDGTLVTNTSQYISPNIGEGTPLLSNIKFLQDKYKNGKCKIIITTSRPEKFREITESELNKWDIPFDNLIMGLPHAKRYLINDFSPSNPFPTSVSINIERNKDNLVNYHK